MNATDQANSQKPRAAGRGLSCAHPRRKSHDSSGLRAEEGFVLVPVLWLAGLAAALTAAFVLVLRSELLEASVHHERAQSEQIADAAAALAVVRIMQGSAMSSCRWDDRTLVRVRIQDQGGLADLNAASEQLLVLVFSAVMNEVKAKALAKDVLRHRDPNPHSAGEGFRGGAFEAVEEIDRLELVDGRLYEVLRPLLTVHSLQQGIDGTVAPPALKAAATAFPANSSRFVYSVDVDVVRGGTTRFSRHAMFALVREESRPFLTLAWDQGTAVSATVASDMPPCVQ